MLRFMMKLPSASIDKLGETKRATKSSLLMDNFPMAGKHYLGGKETRRGAIWALIAKTLVIPFPDFRE